MTRKPPQQPAPWMQKAGVLLVAGILAFFIYMILLDAFGVIDEDVSVYNLAMAAIVVVVAMGLFASSVKNWPAWPLG